MRPLSLAVVKIRKKEKENTRNFDVNNNKKKRILSTNQNSAGFEGIVVESFDVRSLGTMSNPVSGIRFNAAALDALHFQMQIHRCGGHQRGQVYSSDDILVACEPVIKSNLSFVFFLFLKLIHPSLLGIMTIGHLSS